jgi:hypothetical protein
VILNSTVPNPSEASWQLPKGNLGDPAKLGIALRNEPSVIDIRGPKSPSKRSAVLACRCGFCEA